MRRRHYPTVFADSAVLPMTSIMMIMCANLLLKRKLLDHKILVSSHFIVLIILL